MPRVRSLDGSAENGWCPPPTTVCESAQVQHNRVRPNWPFLISYEDGKTYINKGERITRNKEINRLTSEIGDALL